MTVYRRWNRWKMALIRFVSNRAALRNGLATLPTASAEAQGPHNEHAFAALRPRVCGFYAETAPSSRGDTALFDTAAVMRQLKPSLQSLLKESTMRCDFALNTGVTFNETPAVLIHPDTKALVPNLYFYGSKLGRIAHEAYVAQHPQHAAGSKAWGSPFVSANRHQLFHPELGKMELSPPASPADCRRMLLHTDRR